MLFLFYNMFPIIVSFSLKLFYVMTQYFAKINSNFLSFDFFDLFFKFGQLFIQNLWTSEIRKLLFLIG